MFRLILLIIQYISPMIKDSSVFQGDIGAPGFAGSPGPPVSGITQIPQVIILDEIIMLDWIISSSVNELHVDLSICLSSQGKVGPRGAKGVPGVNGPPVRIHYDSLMKLGWILNRHHLATVSASRVSQVNWALKDHLDHRWDTLLRFNLHSARPHGDSN